MTVHFAEERAAYTPPREPRGFDPIFAGAWLLVAVLVLFGLANDIAQLIARLAK